MGEQTGKEVRSLALNWLFRVSLEHASENTVNWIYQPKTEKPARDLYVKVTKICLVTEDHRKNVCTGMYRMKSDKD